MAADLVVGDVGSGIVTVAHRLGDEIIRPAIVVVHPLGHQDGQEIHK